MRATDADTFRSYDPLNEDDWHPCLRGQISTSQAVHSILDELDDAPRSGESLSIAVSCWLTEWQGLCVLAASNSTKRTQLRKLLAEREASMMRILGKLEQRAAKRERGKCPS